MASYRNFNSKLEIPEYFLFNNTNEELAGDMPRNSIERYRLYFAAGASYNAMIHWLKSGCKESVEEMAQYTFDFL